MFAPAPPLSAVLRQMVSSRRGGFAWCSLPMNRSVPAAVVEPVAARAAAEAAGRVVPAAPEGLPAVRDLPEVAAAQAPEPVRVQGPRAGRAAREAPGAPEPPAAPPAEPVAVARPTAAIPATTASTIP